MAHPMPPFLLAALLLLAGGQGGGVRGQGQAEPVPPPFNQTVIDAFRSKVLLNPPPVPIHDPYDEPGQPGPPNRTQVCGVLYVDGEQRVNYRLETFESRERAQDAGAHVTHLTECGLCSSLEDLAAYMSHWDMTAPARACGVVGAISRELGVRCLRDLGLTSPCAEIWMFNAAYTRQVCLLPCLENWGTPYNLDPIPPGALNECLQCDEDEAGPVFQDVAARTRRNSGMRSAIWRDPSEVADVIHDYW